MSAQPGSEQPGSGRADPEQAEAPVCSAKGCTAPAVWALHWNNPKIHDPGRRKTWLACAEHREFLGDFLARRSFLRETAPLG